MQASPFIPETLSSALYNNSSDRNEINISEIKAKLLEKLIEKILLAKSGSIVDLAHDPESCELIDATKEFEDLRPLFLGNSTCYFDDADPLITRLTEKKEELLIEAGLKPASNNEPALGKEILSIFDLANSSLEKKKNTTLSEIKKVNRNFSLLNQAIAKIQTASSSGKNGSANLAEDADFQKIVDELIQNDPGMKDFFIHPKTPFIYHNVSEITGLLMTKGKEFLNLSSQHMSFLQQHTDSQKTLVDMAKQTIAEFERWMQKLIDNQTRV